jgi:hypothetical protein
VRPLHALPERSVSLPWLLQGMAIVAAFVLWVVPRFLDETLPPRRLLPLAALCFVTLGLSVAMIDGYRVFFFLRAVSVAADAPLRDAMLAGALLSCAVTYATAFLLLFLGVLSQLVVRKDRRRLGRLAGVAAVAALVCVAVHVLLFLTTGFDPVKTFQAAIAFDQEAMAKNDGSLLRSLNVGVANLAAFLAAVGIPVTVVWAGEVGTAARRSRLAQEGDLVLLGYVASLVLIAFSTLFTLEVERVWLFMTPFVAAPAAHYLHGRYLEGDRSALRWTFGLLALQLVAFEALLRTPW